MQIEVPPQTELALNDKQNALMALVQMAVAQNQGVDSLSKILEFQERYEANEARKAYNLSMARFKENPPRIVKDKTVHYEVQGKPDTHYMHASLENICEKVIEALSNVGISHRWLMNQGDNGITVTCILTHVMGHSESTSLRSAPDQSGGKNSIQAIGSAVTYLQRYTLLAAVGIAVFGADNDGRTVDRMTDSTLQEWLDSIRASSSIDELKKTYRGAYEAAGALLDKQSQAVIVAAKNERYKVIRAQG